MKLILSWSNANSATLKWSFDKNSGSSCYDSFNAVIKNRNNETFPVSINVTHNIIKADKLSRCLVYTAEMTAISAHGEHITSNEINFALKEDKQKMKVINMNVTAISYDSINVSWAAVDSINANCLHEHQLELYDKNNKLIRKQKVFEKKAKITNLLPNCKSYLVKLVDVDGKLLAERSFATSVQFPFDDLKVSADKQRVEITWPKVENRECLLGISVQYVLDRCSYDYEQEDKNKIKRCKMTAIDVNKNQTMMTITQLLPWKTYVGTFYVHEVTPYKPYKFLKFHTTIDQDLFHVENINEFRISINEARVSWSFHQYFLEDLDYFELNFDGQVYKTINNYINFKIAPCKMNYTLTVQCIGKGNLKGEVVTYKTNLQDDQVASTLSSLTGNVTHRQKSSNAAELSWTPIKEEISCIKSYEIEIEKGLQSLQFSTAETNVEIDTSPCLTYTVRITPISHSGSAGLTTLYKFTADKIGRE